MLSITPSNRMFSESILAFAPQEDTEILSPSLWYTANFQYLLAAVERVCEALKQHSQEQLPQKRGRTHWV